MFRFVLGEAWTTKWRMGMEKKRNRGRRYSEIMTCSVERLRYPCRVQRKRSAFHVFLLSGERDGWIACEILVQELGLRS